MRLSGPPCKKPAQRALLCWQVLFVLDSSVDCALTPPALCTQNLYDVCLGISKLPSPFCANVIHRSPFISSSLSFFHFDSIRFRYFSHCVTAELRRDHRRVRKLRRVPSENREGYLGRHAAAQGAADLGPRLYEIDVYTR